VRIAVLGAGIAGVACARVLADAGHDVTILDRGRTPGGRMASRRLRDTDTRFDGRIVDYGASYFTSRGEGFSAVVERWEASGLARAWTDTFHVYEPGGIIGVRTGPLRYAAPEGLRSLVEDLAADLPPIRQESEVTSLTRTADGFLVDGDTFDRVAVCMPIPQAQRFIPGELLPPDTPTWEPVIAVTMVFDERTWLDIDGVFVNDDPVLTWIADDGRRRGDDAPVLVAHVNPVLAAAHLEDPSGVGPLAVATTRQVLGVDELPDWVWAHRWSLARPMEARAEDCWVHPDTPIGFAGDAWAGRPRVESAWHSGTALGHALIR
jgi:predicted NAD/FAD-dependent oxidoreductase